MWSASHKDARSGAVGPAQTLFSSRVLLRGNKLKEAEDGNSEAKACTPSELTFVDTPPRRLPLTQCSSNNSSSWSRRRNSSKGSKSCSNSNSNRKRKRKRKRSFCRIFCKSTGNWSVCSLLWSSETPCTHWNGRRPYTKRRAKLLLLLKQHSTFVHLKARFTTLMRLAPCRSAKVSCYIAGEF